MAGPAAPSSEVENTSEKSEKNISLRYKCLIFDHDDTSVASTAAIHYPAHCAAVRELLPERLVENGGDLPVTLEGWFKVNHNPGVAEYLKSVFGFDRKGERWEGLFEVLCDKLFCGGFDCVPAVLERCDFLVGLGGRVP